MSTGPGRLGAAVGGALMILGSLLPWGFSDYGPVFGLEYGGPVVSRLSDWASATRWSGDAWIIGLVGVVLIGLAAGGAGTYRLLALVALAGVALSLYEWSHWVAEAGAVEYWTQYHDKDGPGPVVAGVGGAGATAAAAVGRLRRRAITNRL